MPTPPRVLSVLALATLPLLAAKVVVEPRGREFHAGPGGAGLESKAGSPFQFHAKLEGAGAGKVAWEWSVVDLDGKTVLADAGSISAQGVYTPPAVSLSRYRVIKLRATALTGEHPSGTVLVTIRPHLALTPLAKVWGKHWRGERVERLADFAPIVEQTRAAERKAKAGDSSDSDRSDPDDSAEESDSDAEFDVGGREPFVTAFAAQVPWAEPAARKDQWIVAAHKKLCLVSDRGKIRPVPADVTAWRSVGGRQRRYRPLFTQVAVKPLGGTAESAWACYLWDVLGHRLWRLDAQGRLGEFKDMNGLVAECAGFAVDRAGNVYLNGGFQNALSLDAPGDDSDAEETAERSRTQAIYRIATDGTVALLAGGQACNRPVDGVGPQARFSQAMGLALAEDRGCAYVVDGDRDDQAWVRTITLADGTVTSRPLDHRRFHESPLEEYWPAYHRGTLLVSRGRPAALYAVDPATGHCDQVYWDGISPRVVDKLHRREEVPVPSEDLVPGPCFHKTRGVARTQCGSLGLRFNGIFSVGDDGQIAVMGKTHQMGLVLLDWADPRSPLGRSGNAGTAAGAGREEHKVTAAGAGREERKVTAAGAGREERKVTAAGAAGEERKVTAAGAAGEERKVTAAGAGDSLAGSGTGAGHPGALPRIERFQPASGGPGTVVVVYGQNLERVDRVLLGIRQVPTFTVGPAGTSLTFNVPLDAAATPAPILVSCPDGTGGRLHRAMSQEFFTVLPGAPAGSR
jgi:hypothetical protein